MLNKNVSRWTVPLFGASLSLFGFGCAAAKPPPPAEAPVFTSADVKAAPIPIPIPVAPLVVVSTNLRASDELVAACKLNFDDVESAPKFDFDRSNLQPQDNDVLTQIAACVTTGPLAGRTLSLIGRADPRGEDEYNMALGDRRASSVGAYLSDLGVNDSQLAPTSRGKLDATGTDESGWQRDRRVDISLGGPR